MAMASGFRAVTNTRRRRPAKRAPCRAGGNAAGSMCDVPVERGDDARGQAVENRPHNVGGLASGVRSSSTDGRSRRRGCGEARHPVERIDQDRNSSLVA